MYSRYEYCVFICFFLIYFFHLCFFAEGKKTSIDGLKWWWVGRYVVVVVAVVSGVTKGIMCNTPQDVP